MIYSKQQLLEQKSLRPRYLSFSDKDIFDSINESKIFNEYKNYDIFLSHSYTDKDIIDELVFSLKKDYNFNYKIYIDWKEDPKLDRTEVNIETVKILKTRMKKCKALLYVTSENHSNSKWMPWELGYFDGSKNDKVSILPISIENNSDIIYKGQEYLGIYPYITVNENSFGYNKKDLLVYDKIRNDYTYFDNWLKK